MKKQTPSIMIGLLLVVFLFAACKDDKTINEEVVTNENITLLSVKTNALVYDEILKTVDLNYLPFYHIKNNKNFSNKIFFEYNNKQQIISTTGGIVLVSLPDFYFATLIYTDYIKDTIQYIGDTIITINSSFNSDNPNITKSVIKNDQLVFRKVILNYPVHAENNYTYSYSGDKITETMNGVQTANYYLTEGNLTKVEKLIYNKAGDISKKTEMIFSGYDKSINLLKGKFFITGAFYCAFSENNHNKMVVQNYSMVDNELAVYSRYPDTITYHLNSANVPDLFNYRHNSDSRHSR
jgi:hypothetical protein